MNCLVGSIISFVLVVFVCFAQFLYPLPVVLRFLITVMGKCLVHLSRGKFCPFAFRNRDIDRFSSVAEHQIVLDTEVDTDRSAGLYLFCYRKIAGDVEVQTACLSQEFGIGDLCVPGDLLQSSHLERFLASLNSYC